MVFSSTTVPHDTQKPFPALDEYSITVPEHVGHVGIVVRSDLLFVWRQISGSIYIGLWQGFKKIHDSVSMDAHDFHAKVTCNFQILVLFSNRF